MKFALVCACGKIEKQKYILSLSLDLVKVGGYSFPTHVMALGTHTSFMSGLSRQRV
jgi:hypothetical protein